MCLTVNTNHDINKEEVYMKSVSTRSNEVPTVPQMFILLLFLIILTFGGMIAEAVAAVFDFLFRRPKVRRDHDFRDLL